MTCLTITKIILLAIQTLPRMVSTTLVSSKVSMPPVTLSYEWEPDDLLFLSCQVLDVRDKIIADDGACPGDLYWKKIGSPLVLCWLYAKLPILALLFSPYLFFSFTSLICQAWVISLEISISSIDIVDLHSLLTKFVTWKINVLILSLGLDTNSRS